MPPGLTGRARLAFTGALCCRLRNRWRQCWRHLPLSAPGISSFSRLYSCNPQRNFTVSIGLAAFRQEEGTIWNLLMAASVITLMPTLIVFMFTQKYFVRGIVTTGIK